jgi:hypothetical protein
MCSVKSAAAISPGGGIVRAWQNDLFPGFRQRVYFLLKGAVKLSQSMKREKKLPWLYCGKIASLVCYPYLPVSDRIVFIMPWLLLQ